MISAKVKETTRSHFLDVLTVTFEILSTENRDGLRWRQFLRELPPEKADIHFCPEYGAIYRDTYGYEPLLAVYATNEGFVLQPFVRRPLRDLPFLKGVSDSGRYNDITNAYGFGGPLYHASNLPAACTLYRYFSEAFDSWCLSHHVASEFTSLHPFFVQDQLAFMQNLANVSYQKDVVYIDLLQGEPQIWGGLRKGHRSSVKVARRRGVKIDKVELTAANLRHFSEMYHLTMQRRRAASRWFLPDSYFANCAANLGNHRASLFFAMVDGELESACFLIHDFSTAYYHFAATRANHPELGVNNLMVYEAALWAKDAGFSRLHLGGGVTSESDDSLLRFKTGFSDKRAPLHTYFRIRDPIDYNTLSELKYAHELATLGSLSKSDFFPIYRR